MALSQYWQQKVDFRIDVTLNDKEHALDGFEQITYLNNSPDTLHFIWFHVWPNAYKNDRTAFSDQMLENGSTQFYFSEKEKRGYINRLDFKVNNVTARVEDHPNNIDIIKVVLPSPLPPGEKIMISTPFHVQLPHTFSRNGHVGNNYHITQWYPKPAVYDRKGWHPIPYLDQGEFYSEFGDYTVKISVPSNYIVASTGELQETAEKSRLKELSDKTKEQLLSDKAFGDPDTIRTSTEWKTLTYVQHNIHDFAWFTSKHYRVLHDTLQISSGHLIDVYSFFYANHRNSWKNTLQYLKDAIRTRSEWVGEYPYNVLSVVQDVGGGGGMEYPTITLVSASGNERMLEYIISHEVSHNWFQGILASNERVHPWLDEGINTYYDNRYTLWRKFDKGELNMGSNSMSIKDGERLIFETYAATKKDQPIETHGAEFTNVNYNMIAYYKTGLWMELLEKELGQEIFDKAMQEYYRQWKFKHPYPEDLKKIFENVSGKDLTKYFNMLHEKGTLPDMERKGWKVASPLAPNSIIDYIKNPTKDMLLISPVVGFNSYDKLMLGAMFTNYKLPPPRFGFFIAPLYSMKAKKLNGLADLNYSFFPDGIFRKIDVFASAATFSNNEFQKEDGDKVLFGFTKIAPGLRFTLNERSSRSSISRYIQWKSFLINEESYRIRFDTTIILPDTFITQVVGTRDDDRTLHQLRFVLENNRVLYPYSANITLEHGKDFIRAGVTGNYYFNYPKEGGFNVRLFGGKFFYIGDRTFSKQFSTDRYHLNMTGPNGYEDYTYSDYFVGRNKFESLGSQQVMLRDGAFKVRTDLYAQKVGKTDDWLAAINLTTSIPSQINPLTMLPVKIPLKAFVDIGTYAEAWDRKFDADRFVFDAGLQVSLFKNLVNIYFPLVYSSVYKEYIQSILEKKGRFFKKMSFSIDISNFSLRKVNRELTW